MKAATSEITTSEGLDKTPKEKANKEMKMLPNMPARVPSRLTAPSVPFGTSFNVVMRYVVRPYAFPSSEEKVSESLVANEAT